MTATLKPLTWSPTALPEMRRCMVETSRFVVSQYAEMGAEGMHRRMLAQHGAPSDLSTEMVEYIALEESALLASFQAAELYWVTPQMTELAVDAATDLPEWVPGLEAPALNGIIAFAESLPVTVTSYLPRKYDVEVPSEFRVDGISWWIHSNRIMVTFLSRFERTSASMSLRPGELVPFNSLLMPADKPVNVVKNIISETGFDLDDLAKVVQVLGAAWVLMAEPTVAERRSVTGSGTSRRAVKHLGRTVTVIELRRLKHVSTGPVSPSGRTYTHRWVVRGHWRNQAYGPGRAQHRPTFIPPHTKGPDNAPLLRNERVYVWRR